MPVSAAVSTCVEFSLSPMRPFVIESHMTAEVMRITPTQSPVARTMATSSRLGWGERNRLTARAPPTRSDRRVAVEHAALVLVEVVHVERYRAGGRGVLGLLRGDPSDALREGDLGGFAEGEAVGSTVLDDDHELPVVVAEQDGGRGVRGELADQGV